jgi:hypothetical protein
VNGSYHYFFIVDIVEVQGRKEGRKKERKWSQLQLLNIQCKVPVIDEVELEEEMEY